MSQDSGRCPWPQRLGAQINDGSDLGELWPEGAGSEAGPNGHDPHGERRRQVDRQQSPHRFLVPDLAKASVYATANLASYSGLPSDCAHPILMTPSSLG